MDQLFIHIKSLVQIREPSVRFVGGKAMKELPTLENAYLVVKAGKIAAFGPMTDCPDHDGFKVIDATGKLLLPTWCDSHTHLVYAGDRSGEFVDRINGLSYAEIAERGGGILNSAKKLQQTTPSDLYRQSKNRLDAVMKMGTGALEIKSGYGLTPQAELKMLRVIQELKTNYALPIKATFLGAHALPPEYTSDTTAYLNLMIETVLPTIAKEALADYIDIFCETGYFSVADMEHLLAAGARYGLRPKVHVNQFTALGGIDAAVHHKALSVDHLEILRKEDLTALKGTTTIPVALPGCSFFLGIPYTPARQIIDAGLPLALASDYNPGSAPSGNMNFVMATACIKMQMTPEEAINAATLNGAYAMGLEQEVGSITIGKRANLILTQAINGYASLPYTFGEPLIDRVFINGKPLTD